MRFHVLTLFPEMITQGLSFGVIGRALEREMISLNAVNIRDYTTERHGKVDDYPYGGGAGMLMQAQPVYDAHRAVTEGHAVRTVYVTPQGTPFTQKKAEELSREKELVVLCGHYEGIDERVLEEIVTDYISIGDYVLTGGELPAMVMIDAIARLVPGVLGNDFSAEEESFYNDLLEYPQYSRPECWHGVKVPEVLLSGNHGRISAWRLERSLERTAVRRPDLYGKYKGKQLAVEKLAKDKRNNIHMMESLTRGRGEILYTDIWAGGGNILLYDTSCRTAMLTAADAEAGRRLAGLLPGETELALISQPFMEPLLEEGQYRPSLRCRQFVYTQKVPLPVRHKDIRRLDMDSLEYVCAHYCGSSEDGSQPPYSREEVFSRPDRTDGEGGPGVDRRYVQERIQAGAVYGAFEGDRLVGFAGVHADGGIGMLYVEESCRGRGIGVSLESYVINRILERGWTPYGHVTVGNERSFRLQERLGLYESSKTFCWLEKSTCK